MADTSLSTGTTETNGRLAAARAPARPATAPRRELPWRDPLLRRLLAVADALAVLVAALVLAVFFANAAAGLWLAALVPVWLVLAKLHGLYDRDHRSLRHVTADELPALIVWSLTGTAAATVVLLVTPVGSIDLGTALALWLAAWVSVFCFRSLARLLWRRVTSPERTLIVGEGPLADATRRKVELFRDIHVRLVGGRPRVTTAELRESPPWLADVDRIILASAAVDEELIAELVAVCRRSRIKLSVVPPARGMFGTAVQLNHVADLPVVEYNTWDVSRSTLLLKRVVDIVVSAIALVVLAPLLGAVALAIRLDSPGPVLFAQRRAGLGGHPFRMFKFRTMVDGAEDRLAEVVSLDQLREPMFKLADDPRVTRVGRLLRRTSIDELPQLWNVLRGEMSLVGPRPEQIELTERYAPEHRFRLGVKPGLTGPMQVFGRGELSFDERLAVEREYIENLSLGRDLRILAHTLTAVGSRRGAF